MEYSPPLDKGIKRAVEILASGGIETYESCEGGPGHAYLEPTVRFHGQRSEGFKALAIALQNGLNPSSLRRLKNQKNTPRLCPICNEHLKLSEHEKTLLEQYRAKLSERGGTSPT